MLHKVIVSNIMVSLAVVGDGVGLWAGYIACVVSFFAREYYGRVSGNESAGNCKHNK